MHSNAYKKEKQISALEYTMKLLWGGINNIPVAGIHTVG